jgi:hypothetical protein
MTDDLITRVFHAVNHLVMTEELTRVFDIINKFSLINHNSLMNILIAADYNKV